ncbi:MAG: hypothetical protein KC464_26920, partial [Myxococcales bacterium]|nr:hypothetical protein [Myxococcales bacterium]
MNYGYGYASSGYAQGGVTVGEPSPYYVSSLPPDPLYETMSSSPGYGYSWIDGYWHWNGYEWVWVSGRWVQAQQGYVYVQPYYDWSDDGRYVYTPGYWSRPERVPARVKVVDHRDGRPPTGYQPPRPHVGDRAPVRDHRGTVQPPRPGNDGHGGTRTPPPRDHRDPGEVPPTRPPPTTGDGGGTRTPPP